jgi:hypothetical protein
MKVENTKTVNKLTSALTGIETIAIESETFKHVPQELSNNIDFEAGEVHQPSDLSEGKEDTQRNQTACDEARNKDEGECPCSEKSVERKREK